MKDVKININPERVLGDLTPLLFGHFIEFMHDCIDPGLHAELLTSRGFEYPEEAERGVSPPWHATGDAECSLDRENVYAVGKAQRVEVSEGEGGVRQDGLLLHAGTGYSGYAHLFAEGAASVRVRIFDELGELFEKRFELDVGGWVRCEFDFVPDRTSARASFAVTRLGRGVLWVDQASLKPDDRIAGVWPKVMERIEALQMGVLRFPGGCFADTYHWMDGIGPVDRRPGRPNRHWGGTEENNFGTDEFLSLCRHLGSEPLICVNFGDATPEEAAHWVEYCNGNASTRFGALRAENGHPEPYGVKYWDIGNEMFAEWETGHCTAGEYAERYVAFAKAMRGRDPSIKLIACAGDGNQLDQSWNETILRRIKAYVDILGLHTYAPMIADATHAPKALYDAVVGGAPQKFERVLKDTLKTVREHCGPDHPIKLAVTEWNTSYHNQSLREQTFEAALSNAGLLNAFLRNSGSLALCTASDLVNGWPGGLIRSARGECYGTPSYHVIGMVARQDLKYSIHAEVQSETFDCEQVGNVPAQADIPLVDAAAGLNGLGQAVLFAVNRSRDEGTRLIIEGVAFARAHVLLLHTDDFNQRNGFENEPVVPVPVEMEGEITLPPMAVAAIILE